MWKRKQASKYGLESLNLMLWAVRLLKKSSEEDFMS